MTLWSSSPNASNDCSGEKRKRVRWALISLVGIGLAGCVSTPPKLTDKLLVAAPESWANESARTADFDASNWLNDFDDPKLRPLIDEALEYNLDLKAAASRLDAALANSVVNRSSALPSLSVSGSGSKARRNSASGIQQTPTSETYGISGRFNWEVDLWGKVRNGYRGDLADAEAAIADYQAARLSIAARTAKAWYTAVEATQQYELETRILEALEASSRIVEENFASGIAGALDVRLVRANLASTRSSLEQRRRSRDRATRSLELLLGRYPANELALASELPEISSDIPVGLPSQLLLRRPDVVAAERRLAALEQRKFETSKARLPSLNLNLTRGTSSSEISEVLEVMENRIWSQSLSVAQTLFQGGRLKADYQRAKANYEASLASYTQTVLTAFREVEETLSEQGSYKSDYEFLQIAAQESIDAERLAWEEYARGLSNITTALDSVRRSVTSQRSLIQVTNQRIQSRIDLYLALGGGFGSEAGADS